MDARRNIDRRRSFVDVLDHIGCSGVLVDATKGIDIPPAANLNSNGKATEHSQTAPDPLSTTEPDDTEPEKRPSRGR
jgi:hypothetical protein